MSEKYKVRNREGIYFITITVIDCVDLLTRKQYKDVIIDSLKYCKEQKGLIVHAFVIMSNHMHLIVSAKEAVKLQDVIRDFKKFTSKKLIEAIEHINESRREWLLKKFAFAAQRIKRGVNYKLWQDGFHPIELQTGEMVMQKLEYIHNNPVEAGIVNEQEHYVYSSAVNYTAKNGILDVEFVV